MGSVLKFVSTIYLAIIGLGLAGLVFASFAPVDPLPPLSLLIAFAVALGLALPAIALYAFGSIADDVRSMNRNIARLANGVTHGNGQSASHPHEF